MPIYSIQGPDGKIYEIEGPAGATKAQVVAAIQAKMQASAPAPSPEIAPAPIAPPKKEGFGAAFGKGIESILSPSRTAIGALTGSAEEAALAGLKRAEESPYADQVSLEKVKQAYERGLLPAAGEVLRQIPLAITEQAPNIAATLGSARLGAMAGAGLGSVVPGLGTAVGTIGGGLLGAVAPSLLQQFGGNIQRQAQEQLEAKQPVNISRTAAAAAAAPQAALDVAATFIPLGRNIAGSVLGPQVKQLLERGAKESAEKLARESLPTVLAKGAGISIATEAPTEALQSMLERAQAGLPLLSDDALKEYGEAAYQASLIAPIGAAARVGERSTAREQVRPPEVRPGETDRQAAERIQAELLAMKEAAKPPAPGPILSTNNLYNLMAQPNGYGLVEQYKQRLMALPNQTPEVEQAIEEAAFIQKRADIEKNQRKPTKAVLTDKTLKQMGFKPKDGVYESLLGKDMASPDQAEEITQALSSAKAQEDITPAFVGRIDNAINVVNDLQQRIYPKAKEAEDVGQAITPPSGEGVQVAGEPGAGVSTERPAAPVPGGVVPAVEDAGQPPTGKGAKPTPIEKVWKTKPDFVLSDYPIDAEILNLRKMNEIAQRQKISIDVNQMASDALKSSGRIGEVFEPAGSTIETAPVVSTPSSTRDAVAQHAVKGLPIIEAPIEQLSISKDVPQFKSEADVSGIVKPLEGKFERTGVAPIQLWRREDGRLEVISGRHRFDLAKRSGETTIPAQIHDEAAGFDAAKAATLDAELNIRDEQGEVKDYVVYFERSGISEADAKARGLLGRTVGQRGWAIASQGSPDLIAAHRAGIVPDDAAAGIATIAPKDSRLQAVGLKAVRDNKSTPAVLNTMQAVKALAAERGTPQEEAGDLFGFDDSAIKEAEEMARIATDKQREVSKRLDAISGAAKRPDVAKAEGIDIKDEAALNKRIQELRQLRASWSNWSSSPDLIKEIRDEMTKPVTPAPAVPVQTVKPPEVEAPTAKLSLRLNEAIQAAKSDIEAQIKDWSSRVYKANKKQVELAGDGPSRQASMSVSQINESKRRRAVEGLQAELKAVRDLEKQIADPEMAERLLNKSKRLFKEAQERVASGEAQRKDAGLEFEATLLSELGIRPPRGAYESNNISKAIRRVVETMPDEPKVTEQEAKPYEPLTAQQEEDVLGLFAVARGEPKKSLVEMRKRYEAGRAAPAPVETKPEPTELDKEIQAKTEELGRVLSRILGKFGLKDVALNLVEDMKAEGEYAQSVIRLALDAVSPVQALRHESIHALKELGFFTSQQWAALEKQAKSKWVDQYLKNVNINKEPLGEGEKSRYDAYMDLYKGDMDAIIEEAIADAFGDFDVNKAPPGLMQALLNRLRNFFDAIKTAFGGEITAEQVFRKAEKGELGKVTAAGSQSITKESLRIMRGEERPDLGKNVTVDKVGKYFDDQIIQEFDGKLDYKNPQHLERAIQQATEEIQYQIKQKNSGLDWYEEDIQKAFKDTIKVLPELKKEDNRILFSVMAGMMSPETNARDNWFIASKAFEHYVKTGDIPGVNPENGNLWMGGTQSANKKIQLEFLDRMVKDLGVKKTVKWLMSPQTVKDINQYRAKYGNLKSGINGKATDLKPNGLFAFGEKIGPFISNINGIHDVTVDKWFIRTFNRYFGTMIGPDGKIVNAPTEPERRVVKELANRVAANAGIKNYQVQSLLWFYEQRLFTELGASSPSYGFSDGARKFLDARGKGAVPAGAVPAKQAGAGGVKPSLRAPQTEAFKRWFGDSKIINPDGTPKVMYHGTARDITEFRPKQAGAIFVTDNPDFAEMFADASNDWIARHYKDFLSADQIKAAKNNVPRILKEMGYRGDEAASYKKQIEMDSPSGGALDVWTAALKEQLPTGPNVMPLYVRAEKPFDYENPEHLEQLNKYEQDNRYTERTISYFVGSVKNGSWEAIESRRVQDAIKSLGFDGFYVKEGGVKNLAVYQPEQLKSATGNIGTFDATKPDIRYSLRDSIGLYSELENKVAQGPNKAPAASWKAYINGLTQKGVKPEEIEWSGVRDWLDLQTGPVSKDAVNAYLKQGGVRVEEVVLGKLPVPRNSIEQRWLDEGPRNEAEDEDYQAFIARGGEDVRYGTWVLPGGKNYREVLLTLPTQLKQASKQLEPEIRALGITEDFGDISLRTLRDAGASEDLQRRFDQAMTSISKEYRSTHWEQPNVLAHIRLNDRTDADGNKVLFVEEIQSDWGQEGKKKGFVGDLIPQDTNWQAVDTLDTVRTRAEAEAKLEELQPFLERNREPGMESRLVIREGDGFFDIVEESRSPTATAPSRYGIPRAPFVTKTEGWLNLALKRIMVMAAEGGYDKVAFVDGAQSANRYDLSKQIDRIDYNRNGDGTYSLSAIKNSTEVFSKESLTLDEVEDTVGKDIAKKIEAGEGQSVAELDPVDRWEPEDVTAGDFDYDKTPVKSLSGLDLKVGGEGMKAFYNQIVPIAVKKLLPKVGGGKMEDVSLLKDSFKKYDKELMKDDLKALGEEGFRAKYAHDQQPGFSVTPEMKQKVETTGLPRFSLRSTIPTATRQRIVQTTIARDEKTFYQRIIEAISPNNFQSFRADALNRYDQLSVYDKKLAQKMGGKALLASSSAESAALFSDLGAGLTASALGVHDRMGGVPVYRNGVTIISNMNGTVKGPTAIFAPLAKQPGDYQAYQYWAGVKRGSRFLADGREQLFEPADIKKAEDLRKQYLKDGIDFNNIQKEWTKFNDGLVDYMVATGVLSKERADIYKKHSDYLPFYRQMDGVETVGPKIFQSISGIKPPKKLKGGEAPIDDFLENIVRNTQSAIQAGIKNIAAQRAADVAVKIQMADRLDYHSTAPNVFHVYENGKPVSYVTQDQLFINAVKSLGLPDLPFIGLFSGPANLLRNLVTKDPGFMLANLMRDSMSAWSTSGVKMTPMVNTASNFVSAIAGKSPEFQALMNSGILGGYEFSQNVEQSGREFGKALRKQANVKQPGMKGVLEMGAKPFTSLWEALEKGSTASDAATRMEVYKRTLAETGNEAEALYRALEVMNFNRKGSSAVVRVLTAAVPFLNARMQGLDVLYRAATGKMNVADAKQVQRNFFIRGATIAALSTLYWALTHDDDEYKKQEQETRDNYWLLPSLGVKIPIPFEIGVLFKVIPERILGYTMGSDTGEDFLKSMARQLTSTLAFNPIPQTVLPVVESMTNFSFFTMRPVVGQGLEGLQPAYQVGPSTSRIAEKIGAATKSLPTELQISPAKLDNLINGYTGTMGMYMVNLMDAIFDMNTDSPKPSRRFEQMPLIRRFAIDPEARGSVTAYYELKNSVDAIVRTSNMLERTMNYEELPGYLRDNARMLASKDYILDLEKTMKEFREMKILVRSAKMEADAKRDSIASIEKMENQLTANIQYLKRIAKGG